MRLRDPPGAKIVLQLVMYYFAIWDSAACLSLALQAQGASHIFTQFLCHTFSLAPSLAAVAVTQEGVWSCHWWGFVTLLCRFFSVQCFHSLHVKQRGTSHCRARKHRQQLEALPGPGEERTTSYALRGLGRTSSSSPSCESLPSPQSSPPDQGLAASSALGARRCASRPNTPTARTCCSLTAR